jgi:hypothetical protein
MKKIKLLSVFFLLATAVSFTSCSSDDSNEPVNPPATGTFTVNMGGEAYVATQAQATIANGVLAIAGVRGTSGENIALMIHGTTQGTYQGAFMSYNTSAEEIGYVNVDPVTVQRNGTVTITSITSTMVTGTFQFTGYDLQNGNDPMVFSEGAFSVPLTVTDPVVGQGSVTAFVNGVQANFGFATVMNANGKYIISGMNMGTMQNIQIHIASINPGTYTLSDIWSDQNYAVIGGQSGSVDSVNGTVTVTGNSNGYLTGTFSFTGDDFDGNQVTVTGGQFNAQIMQ